jgi:hypothetical protein
MSRNPLPFRSAHSPLCRRRDRRYSHPQLEILEDRHLLSTNVLTYHNDLSRSGANLSETILTPSNVNVNTFGQLFSYPVDGQIYAQPLYVANVTLPDASVHNIVLVATENDSVYAFDANNPTAGPYGNGILWQDSFIDPAKGITTIPSADVYCPLIKPQIGITDTPVIDPSSGIMYLVAATKQVVEDVTTYHQQLHALAITTGKEARGSPVEIQATTLGQGDGGTSVTFDPFSQLERAGLVLANGVVYTFWTSHCDMNFAHGWVIGYEARTLQPVVVFNTSPNSQLATIWAGASAVDANGNLFFVTGNGRPAGGDFDPSLGDYPETVLKLSPTTGKLAVADYFTPYNWEWLDETDEDFGSGQVMLLPDQPGPIPHLLVVAGKEGKLYLINRDRMGQFNADFDDVVQEIAGAIQGRGAYDTPTYFDIGIPDHRWIYYAGKWDSLRAFQLFDDGTLSTSSTSESSNQFTADHGATPSLSANGTTNGIVWAINAGSPTVLYAYDATNVAIELWDSAQAGARDQLYPGIKFSVPTIADGEVFVGTAYTLSVFGLLSGRPAAPPHPGLSGSRIDPGIVLLLQSMTSQAARGNSGSIHLSSADQGDSVPSQSLLAPLMGSTERVAKDIVFAVIDHALQRVGSADRLSAHDLDLRVAPVDRGERSILPSFWLDEGKLAAP